VFIVYFIDRNPPHFHVEYGGYEASIAINGFGMMEGDLPSRILGFVIEWASTQKEVA
jgi:hypothetical protein